ncbi:hypothetical protein EUTSA_v10012164mg [Eutrema salsugineum]|uniref:F-box domain-containing protein n=1 Tax=Eutrema salsugineum TaxID=72664 RepID=V4KUK5_EUTSA|nr:hypothetical protein EUTSA_v10012164mg [Eutrema salsugineum]
MSSPEKKRKTTESIPNISLPNDLLLRCITHVSILYYPTLSLVSKRLQSLIASSEFYKTRSLLGHTESCLYVVLRFPHNLNPCWFTLCRIPNITTKKKKKKSSANLLVSILSPNSAHAHLSSNLSLSWIVSLTHGTKLQACGGPELLIHSCHHSCMNWIEVFDPKTQTWSSLQNPSVEIREGSVLKSLGLKGKFYLFGDKIDKYCEIDNILFFLNCVLFSWYDFKVNLFGALKGEGCRMVDYGGKLVVFWEECDGYQLENLIWCAEIALERRKRLEI